MLVLPPWLTTTVVVERLVPVEPEKMEAPSPEPVSKAIVEKDDKRNETKETKEIGPEVAKSLKKEAKRWFDALRRNLPDARSRFERVIPNTPTKPTLRDVQHALALEHGFSGWTELKHRLTADAEETARALGQFEDMAEALLEAYRTGTPQAMERHQKRNPTAGSKPGRTGAAASAKTATISLPTRPRSRGSRTKWST